MYINKSNSKDSFFDILGVYFSSDDESNKLISETDEMFKLKCWNNNWLEIFCKDKKPNRLKCLTDPFSGIDIDNNIEEDIKYILYKKDELVHLYKKL